MAIILASASKTRENMLKMIGVEFTVRSSGVDEAAIKYRENLEPTYLAARLAEAEAEATTGSKTVSSSLVISADQVLDLGGVV